MSVLDKLVQASICEAIGLGAGEGTMNRATRATARS